MGNSHDGGASMSGCFTTPDIGGFNTTCVGPKGLESFTSCVGIPGTITQCDTLTTPAGGGSMQYTKSSLSVMGSEISYTFRDHMSSRN